VTPPRAVAEQAARRANAPRVPVSLVARARAGESEAFGRIYEALFEDVSRYIGAIVRDPDRTEDAVAQTFLAAWRGLAKLKRVDRFEAWLFRIAHNEAVAELRRGGNVPLDAVGDPEDPSRFVSPEAVADLSVDHASVKRALLELSDEQRDVLVLRFLREMSHADVARVLGKSEQATRALQYRALRRMLAVLKH
jgi:RNA polymerase sigma-70 factor (ECF subfamily)